MHECSESKTAKEWLKYVKTFPVRVREVVLSCGEPSIWPEIVELADSLLDEKYFVMIYTNLMNTRLLNIQPNRRLRILATYHQSYNQKQFEKHLTALRKLHRVDVDEIDNGVLEGSHVKNWSIRENLQIPLWKSLRVGPDGLVYTNTYDSIKKYV